MDIAYTVYKNARICASEYRHSAVDEAELTLSDFTAQMRTKGYVVFQSARTDHAHLPDLSTTWVVIGPGSAAAAEVKHFRTMWNAVVTPTAGSGKPTTSAASAASGKPTTPSKLASSSRASLSASSSSTDLSAAAAGASPARSVMLVSENKFKHFLVGEISSYRQSMPHLHIEEARWDAFLFEIPKHNANCPHEIIEPAELEEYLTRTHTDPVFKKIRVTDPQAIWIGARVGDVIKIDMTSFSAGVAIDYRVVVAG